jgi:hypothetical protein
MDVERARAIGINLGADLPVRAADADKRLDRSVADDLIAAIWERAGMWVS